MNNFNFGEVLTRAWQIIWKHKVLWIFGILASCGQGSSSGNSSSRTSGDSSSFDSNLPPQFMQFARWLEDNVLQFLIILCAVVCIIWLIAMILSAIGKAGLIRGASQVEGGVESLIFGQLFSESTPFIWRLIGLSLLLGLPVFLFAMVIAVVAIMGVAGLAAGGGGDPTLGILAMTPLLIGCVCLLIPVMFVVGMIFRQSERAIVLEELGVFPAISRGWEIFRANLGPVILMAIILAIIGVVAGLIIAIPIFIIVFPTMLAFMAGGMQNTSPLIFMGICICLYFPVALVLQGIITSYTETAWTLTYLRLTGKPAADNTATPEDVNPPKLDDSAQTIISTRSNA
jgi:hypothetical protein